MSSLIQFEPKWVSYASWNWVGTSQSNNYCINYNSRLVHIFIVTKVVQRNKSISSHSWVNGNLGKVFMATKHFFSFTAKRQCSALRNNLSRLGLVCKKEIWKSSHYAINSSSGINPSVWKHCHPKICVHFDFSWKKDVYNIFSNPFGILGLPETWIMWLWISRN